MEAAGDESAATAAAAVAPFRSRPLLHFKELALGAQNKKIRFTSVHASENFLACGANNGTVFLYATSVNRAEAAEAKRGAPPKYHLVKTIAPHGTSDRAGVSCITLCPQQKRLVVGTIGGVVYGMQLTDYNKIGERVEFTHDFHAGFPVTCFLWNKLGTKLFSACNGGMVAQTTLRAGMSAFFGKADTELLLKEETGIVQLDMTKYGRAVILMVSSQVRVLLLNLTAADGSAVQIGTKARQGNFGACFFTSAADEVEVAKQTNVKVFSSRPGRRVWVADPQTGTVSATLKFALTKTPSPFRQSPGCQTDEAIQSRDLTINKLALFQSVHDPFASEHTLERSLLVSWNTGSSVLFFLDPIAVEIVEWHLDMGTIHDVKVLTESVLVVLHGDPPRVSMLESCSPRQFLDIYAADDVKQAIEMAIEYHMNDVSVVESLKTQWNELNVDARDPKLSAELETLSQNVKDFEERHRAPDLASPAALAAAPLQVIFKQRPQQQQAQLQHPTADSFSPGDARSNKTAPPRAEDYLDLRPSPLSYKRNIYAPDGSTLEAQLVDIKELPSSEPIVRPDFREAWMEEIVEEVRKFEAYKAENEGAMNMLPTLRGTLHNTGAAAKAITTYIPGATMISNLMDTATHVNYGGRGNAMGIFGDLPAPEEALILDPIEFKNPAHDESEEAHECAVLRIAMSATGETASSADTEVLLEAISMDIWDSKLKYISNLPLEKQLSLPDAVVDEDENKRPTSPWATKRIHTSQANAVAVTEKRPAAAERRSPIRKSMSAESLAIEIPSLPPAGDEPLPPFATRRILTRRSSLSPDTGRSAQRALHRHIGGGPSCDFQRKCLVSGALATAPELDAILKREVNDLSAELQSAAASAEKSVRLTRRLWPAAGITRVSGCLANMYLLEGDLEQAQRAIRWWLSCFDPSAKPEDQFRSPTSAKHKENTAATKNGSKPPGFARGEALLDGDGLPLTRSDWTLVRVMVSTFFTISAAGLALEVRPARPDDLSADQIRSYAFEMGIVLEIRHSGAISAEVKRETQWSADEAEAFVKKYGIYLNTELAAEVCNKRQMGSALNAVLDQVVSSSNMSSTCDDVVNWIVEKQVSKVLACLRDMNSLCLLLHVLDLLLKKCPDEAIDLCVSRFPALTPWNVERCLFGALAPSSLSIKELLKPENMPQTAKYFRYLVRLMDSHVEEVGQDQVLVDRCLQLCFSGSKVAGKKFGGAHGDAISWACSVFRQPGRFVYDHKKAWDLCVKNHATVGLLELTCQSISHSPGSPQVQLELEYLVQVMMKKKELILLEELLARLSTMCEESASATIGKLLSHIECAAEKGDDELITTVVHALLNAVGPAEGVKQLARYPLLFAASPLSMYQSIVEAHLLTQRQQEEINQMLETLDTHVWATYKEASMSTSVSFAPQIDAIFELERGGLRAPLDEAKFDKWQAKKSKYDTELQLHRQAENPTRDDSHSMPSFWTNSLTGSVHQVSRCFETRSSDWGGEVQLHDANCAVCDLPVVIIADDNRNMEVALLPCGHAFHTVCASDAACPVCFEIGLVSLLGDAW